MSSRAPHQLAPPPWFYRSVCTRHRSTVSWSQTTGLTQWTKLSLSLRGKSSVFGNVYCLLITASKEARKIGILQTTPIVQGSTTTTVGRVSTRASKPHVFQSVSPLSTAQLLIPISHNSTSSSGCASWEWETHPWHFHLPSWWDPISFHHHTSPDCSCLVQGRWAAARVRSPGGERAAWGPRASGTLTGDQRPEWECTGMFFIPLPVFHQTSSALTVSGTSTHKHTKGPSLL